VTGIHVTIPPPSPTMEKLAFIAGGDWVLVDEATRMAALRGLVQRGEHVADLKDVVDYIIAKRGLGR
jgi:hypothetical protein